MIFSSLDKFKRKMIMMIVVLMFTGLTLFVVPVSYIPFLGKGLGYIFLVLSILRILEFMGSNKAMIHYISLFIGLLLGLAGLLLFAVDGLFLTVLNWLVGTLPILFGGYGLYHALTFARRSGRKGWGLLVFFDCLLLLFGTILFVNPWADSPREVLYVIGGTLFYSALVYAISLLWIWPFQKDDRGDE